jgi:hypothetical protein
MPASERIAQADEAGPAEVVLDNGRRIDDLLRSNPAAEADDRMRGCGCQQAGGVGGLALIGLLPWGRWRRARR